MTEQRTDWVLALNADEAARAREQYEAMMAWLQQKPALTSTTIHHPSRGRRRDLRSLSSEEA